MLRFVFVRRLLKGWNRCYGSRRERTPSSLQECLDHPQPKRGLWHHWFILLILIPILYYVIFLRGTSRYDDYSVPVQREKVLFRSRVEKLTNDEEKESFRRTIKKNLDESPPENQAGESEEKKTKSEPAKPYYQLQRPRTPQYYLDMHGHRNSSKKLYSMNNGTLTANLDGNNTILARLPMPGRHKTFTVTTRGPVPRKYLPVCVAKHISKRTDSSEKPRNTTTQMAYRKLLYKGGLYAPGNCMPRHKVAVLIAYRNRSTNLAAFLYYIHPFLIDQALEYRIFVIEQSGQELFNKGRLFNSGFVEARKYGQWGCIVFHDVDLLPVDTKILYSCPTWPRHMSATILGKQNDPTYRSLFGGVTSMTVRQFTAVNGYSNLYWGWGGEDTDMFWRLKAAGLPIVRYSKSIAKYLALPHEKSPENPIRKQLSNNAMNRYKMDGLTNVVYRLLSTTFYQTYTHFLVDVNPERENITMLQMKWSS